MTARSSHAPGNTSGDLRREAPYGPELTGRERNQTRQRAVVSAEVVHEVVRERGEEELARSTGALWWSGVGAGLSMGLSLVAQGFLRAGLPAEDWARLVARLGYTVGFLAVVLGRQQLFTESTLTAAIPVLSRRNLATFLRLLRLWVTVLAANLAGGLAFALFAAHAGAFGDDLKAQLDAIAREAAELDSLALFVRGILAGWVIALMVWMLPAADGGRTWVIFIMTFVIGAGELSHIIAGSIEVMFGAADGALSWGTYLRYFGPTLAGNTIGGVLLVAVLNHAQVVAGSQMQGGRE